MSVFHYVISSSKYWVAANDIAKEGEILWSDDISVADGGYTNWEDNTNHEEKDCVLWGEHGMKVEFCGSEFGYICQYGK